MTIDDRLVDILMGAANVIYGLVILFLLHWVHRIDGRLEILEEGCKASEADRQSAMSAGHLAATRANDGQDDQDDRGGD